MTVNVTDTVGANNTIVLDGNSKIPAIDGSQVTALSATAFTTGTLATARIDVGTTAGKILQLDGSARMPALSGANLVNAPGPTISTSDPALDTNSTLGKKWINKTSGEVYICTDATAGANVWTNVGAGTGDVAPFPGNLAGSSYGYISCGGVPSVVVDIQRFSFTSDGNTSDVGDMTTAREFGGGNSSATYGYAGGGANPNTNVIDKFAFGSSSNGTDVGNLTAARSTCGVMSETRAYQYGGWNGSATVSAIDTWLFATDANATDWGDLTQNVYCGQNGQNSETHGYRTGGDADGGASMQNIIDKFTFSSAANSTDVGDLVLAIFDGGGASTASHGYTMGGGKAPWVAYANDIQKFPLASDSNSTSIADITVARYSLAGCTSTTHGYAAGGKANPSYALQDVIDKFSFSAESNSTDVGNLAAAMTGANGHQQ